MTRFLFTKHPHLVSLLIGLILGSFSFGQDFVGTDTIPLTDAQIQYLEQIVANNGDTVQYDFVGKKVAFSVDRILVGREEFFNSEIKEVFVINLMDGKWQNNSPFDYLILTSISDLNRKARKRVARVVKQREKERAKEVRIKTKPSTE